MESASAEAANQIEKSCLPHPKHSDKSKSSELTILDTLFKCLRRYLSEACPLMNWIASQRLPWLNGIVSGFLYHEVGGVFHHSKSISPFT